jgi:hypothetical protein
MKGFNHMPDKDKIADFEKYKQDMIENNEQQYGVEARAKFGNEAVERSNARIKGMTEEQHAEIGRLTLELNEAIKAAFEQGDPRGELAQKACGLHKRWLCFYWDENSYCKEAHIGVTQMYVDDPRFTAHYDKIAPGCAAFLRDAVVYYCS